jgi:hypothetical protein
LRGESFGLFCGAADRQFSDVAAVVSRPQANAINIYIELPYIYKTKIATTIKMIERVAQILPSVE